MTRLAEASSLSSWVRHITGLVVTARCCTINAAMRLLLLGLVMLALGQARALAEPAPAVDKVKVAKHYVDAGLAAQSARDYDTALTMYAKAYELVPHPLLIFNMAQAHRLAGHLEEALKLYTRYLAEDPKGAQAKTARELVAELKARKAKTKATDEPVGDTPTGGTLVVQARNQRGYAIPDGTVMIDEEPKGRLASGMLTVPEIAEGNHIVAIETGGYQRFEQTVTVHDGDRARVDALLLDKVIPSSPSHRTAWKVSLGTSIVVSVIGISYAIYNYNRANDDLAPSAVHVTGELGAMISSEDCGKSYQEVLDNSSPKVTSFNYTALQRACTRMQAVDLGYGMVVIGAAGAVVSLIMLSRDSRAPDKIVVGLHGKKPEVALVPIVMPGGGGASFSLRW